MTVQTALKSVETFQNGVALKMTQNITAPVNVASSLVDILIYTILLKISCIGIYKSIDLNLTVVTLTDTDSCQESHSCDVAKNFELQTSNCFCKKKKSSNACVD